MKYAIQTCMVVIVILPMACGNKEQVPEGILTRGQMVSVLSDIYIMEQKVSTMGIKRDSISQIFEVLKDKIFQKEGISDSVFRKSLDYYSDHPRELELIYTSLVDSLNLREQRIPAMQPR